MTSIITGDIINSRRADHTDWMPTLKSVLDQYGKEPEAWEIYRGDSFQLEAPPEEALKIVIHLKASIRQFKGLDVRMAIGIGKKDYSMMKITESNGEAFVNSGHAFNKLNKKKTLSLRSPWPEIDEQLNLSIDLALLTMNGWQTNAAHYIKTVIEHPNWTQVQLAKNLNKSQSAVSESLNRAGFEDIMRLEKKYRKLITNQ